MAAPLAVHITGVSGLIGNALYGHLAAQSERFSVTGSSRRPLASQRVSGQAALHCPPEKFSTVDLGDLDSLRRAVRGSEVIVHLGAVPDPGAPFEAIVASNVVGGYHLLEACRLEGVRRIVYASSVMTNWGYHFDQPYRAIRELRFDQVPASIPQVTHRDPTRPTEPYSASKVWGEGLCRAYADGHDLSCLCVRIGWVVHQDAPPDPAGNAIWCSIRDVCTCLELAVTAPASLRFDIFYAVSANQYRWLDSTHTRDVLGFEPADSAEQAASG